LIPPPNCVFPRIILGHALFFNAAKPKSANLRISNRQHRTLARVRVMTGGKPEYNCKENNKAASEKRSGFVFFGANFAYCTAARKYWPLIVALIVLVNERVEPFTTLVCIGTQLFKSVETCKITVAPDKRPERVVCNFPPITE
jgi:hypothetical protein